MPDGFHHDAVASSATAVKAPAIPCARVPTASAGCAFAGETEDTEATKDTKDMKHTNGREALNMPLTLVPSSVSFETLCGLGERRGVALTRASRYPTSTAAATTVVQRPFLSPTALWVTFCTWTISFDSR